MIFKPGINMMYFQLILNQLLLCPAFKHELELLKVVYVVKYSSYSILLYGKIAYHKGANPTTISLHIPEIPWLDFWKSHFSNLLYWLTSSVNTAWIHFCSKFKRMAIVSLLYIRTSTIAGGGQSIGHNYFAVALHDLSINAMLLC